MANKTIADLVAAGTITGDELIHLIQSGNSRKATLDQIAAAFVGLNVGQGLAAPFRGALLKRTSDLTGVTFPLLVPWQAAEYDTDGFWNAGATTRLTIPAGVQKVRLGGQITLPDNALAHSVFMNIHKNGASNFVGQQVMNVRHGSTGYPDNFYFLPMGPAIPVVAGDYFELRVNTTATSLNAINVADGVSWFAIEVVQATA